MTNPAKLEKLMMVMYTMFLDDVLPDLDMEDHRVMWEALMVEWKVKIPDTWEDFLDDINSTSSNRLNVFKTKFYNHFN